jgi:hypothetical protein
MQTKVEKMSQLLEFTQKISSDQEVKSHNSYKEAAEVLMAIYQERSCEEALMRAVVAERGDDRATSKFWISVFSILASPPRSTVLTLGRG